MARLARVLLPDTPFHITQRGNARRRIFHSDADHLVYLGLLRAASDLHRLSLVGYCLMSNHVHLIAIPHRPDSLPLALQYTHGRYASYFNARHATSGHVWQGRYYSCPLDPPHLWAALRYTERNPVRAGMAPHPIDYPWSTAALHCGSSPPEPWLDTETFRSTWTPALWREYLEEDETPGEHDVIRANTHTGRPLGAAPFVSALERKLNRKLAPSKGGRPVKMALDNRQEILTFQTN